MFDISHKHGWSLVQWI